jgi:copper chaperone
MADLKTETLKVQGMSCGGCVAAVERALLGVNGVAAAVVNLQAGQARVDYDPARTGREELVQAVVRAGFKVTP